MTSTSPFQHQQICDSVKRGKDSGKEPASVAATLELEIQNAVAWQGDSAKSHCPVSKPIVQPPPQQEKPALLSMALTEEPLAETKK